MSNLTRRQILINAIAIGLCTRVSVALPSLFLGISAQSAETALSRKNLVLLAKEFASGVAVQKYWISEKFDGVRAFWDGKTLRFRSGRSIAAPAWFLAKLPATALDGELWLGHGQFDQLSGIVRKTEPVDADWQRVNYLVFEQPQGAGTFTDRLAKLKQIIGAAPWSQLKLVDQFKLDDEKALRMKLAQVTQQGGEGLALHLADAPYQTGRSGALLKLKLLQDTEATVIAHLPGKGKYAGQTGALRVQTDDGKRFKIGTGLSDAERANPPAIGSVVSFSYQGKTPQGVPRFARFLRLHADF